MLLSFFILIINISQILIYLVIFNISDLMFLIKILINDEENKLIIDVKLFLHFFMLIPLRDIEG